MRLLSEISARLVLRNVEGKDSAQELLKWTTAKLAQHLQTEIYFGFVVDEAPKTLKLVSCDGIDDTMRHAISRINYGDYLCGVAAQSRQPVLINDLHECELSGAKPLRDLGVKTFACCPMLAGNQLIGTISFATAKRERFSVEESQLVQTVADLLAAAIERDRLTAAIRASEEHFRIMANGLPIILWLHDDQGRLIFINKTYCEFFGCDFEQVSKDGWQPLIHPQDEHAYVSTFLDAVRTRTSWNHPARVKRADGQWRWVESRSVPRFSESGEFLGAVGCTLDITDRLAYEETLKEADKRKDEFLATLAHELRNPLAPIRSAIAILHKSKESDPAIQHSREVINRQVQQMTRLIDDLLDVSRISRNKLELHCEKVALKHVIDIAVETSRPVIEQHGHHLSIVLPEEPLHLEADPIRLAQVFTNLLNNAAKYTEAGGCIELVAEQDRSEVAISIKDTGMGIDASRLPTIFEMFSQVEGALSRSQGGLGIGLTIVKRLVELHQGSISAASEGIGLGSTFTVRLPLTEAPDDPMPAQQPVASISPPNHKLQVLVVDDNRDAASTLSMLLKYSGYDVHVAHDGEEALQAAEQYLPNVILLDIGLPKLNGYDVARMIRASGWGKAMTLVAITGWGQESDRHKSSQAGFDLHLVKPVDPAELLKYIGTLANPTPEKV